MNKLYAIIGPPASGKSSIVKKLKEYGLPVLISHTTRPPRKYEKDGTDYYFVDKTAFTKMNFVEKASYSNHFYGLTKEEVLSKVNKHPVSIVDIDLNGLDQLKKLLGDRLESVYSLVDKDTIIYRYLDQGEDVAVINHRIEYAEKNGEFNNWQIANHVVKNTGPIDATVRQILAIMNLVTIKELV